MWEEEVCAWVRTAWREACGCDPCSVWQWRRVFRRLGIRKWEIIPTDLLTVPFIMAGVLYLPRVRHDKGRLLRYLAHEAAEAALMWEGCPPYAYFSDQCERHRIACLVEEEVCGT